MLKRLLAAAIIFFVSLGLLMLLPLIGIYREISEGRATGIAFVAGSAGENTLRIGILVALAAFAYWLSGKLISP
jgi:hypothetical protein